MLTLPNPHAEQRGPTGLLACPFCGSLEVRLDLIRMAQVVNCECGARGAGQPSGERAIAAWNHRPALIDHLEADRGAEAMREALKLVIYITGLDDNLRWTPEFTRYVNEQANEIDAKRRALPAKAPSHAS